jgi:hypothetical protein
MNANMFDHTLHSYLIHFLSLMTELFVYGSCITYTTWDRRTASRLAAPSMESAAMVQSPVDTLSLEWKAVRLGAKCSGNAGPSLASDL